jgi:hypothetical protein
LPTASAWPAGGWPVDGDARDVLGDARQVGRPTGDSGRRSGPDAVETAVADGGGGVQLR